QADTLWAKRKTLFFKPFAGYGSKGVYRGQNITKRVFNEILQGGYIAQPFIPAGEQILDTPNKNIGKDTEKNTSMKYDVRYYVYKVEAHDIIARLYQGQTTNFRTLGGGFAAVQTAG